MAGQGIICQALRRFPRRSSLYTSCPPPPPPRAQYRPPGYSPQAPSAPPQPPTDPPPHEPGRRVIDDKHSTEIGARLTFNGNVHAYAQRRNCRCNVGRVLLIDDPHTRLGATYPYASSASGRSVALTITVCRPPSTPFPVWSQIRAMSRRKLLASKSSASSTFEQGLPIDQLPTYCHMLALSRNRLW